MHSDAIMWLETQQTNGALYSVNITALHWSNLLYQHIVVDLFLSICMAVLFDKIHRLVSEIIVTPSNGHLKQKLLHAPYTYSTVGEGGFIKTDLPNMLA